MSDRSNHKIGQNYLNQPIKRVLVQWLDKQPRSLIDIVAVFGLAPKIILAHLAELKRAGLIERVTLKRGLLRTCNHTDAALPCLNNSQQHPYRNEESTVRHIQRSMAMGGLSPDDL